MFPTLKVSLWIILALNLHLYKLQQIFEDVETCKIYKNRDDPKHGFNLKRDIYEIRREGKVYTISPCGILLTNDKVCSPGGCIINVKQPSFNILNAGMYFEYHYDEDNYKDTIRSVNGQKCSATENYTIIIEFNCASNSKETPRILYEEQCKLRLEMMSPECTPRCTTRASGNLIDLRGLSKLGSFEVKGPTTRSFLLSFCRETEGCGSGASVCEVTDGVVQTADIASVFITYYDNKGRTELVFKGHFGSGKRKRRNTEIHLKCNWNEPKVSNLRYFVPQIQGRNYKFEGESAMACVKLPMNCLIVHPNENYLVYDMKRLHKPNGIWQVSDVNFGAIGLNICGTLTYPLKTTICSKQSAQVCMATTDGFYNLGTIATSIQVTNENTLKFSYTEGSACRNNSTKTARTEIELSCSEKEHGPKLESINDCVYIIKWRTPAACPKNMAIDHDCLMHDLLGGFSLKSLSKDSTYVLSSNSYLRYNLCGAIKCNRRSGTVCYVKDGKERIVGHESTVLLRHNTSLSLNLVGDTCSDSRTRSEVRVYFNCNPLDSVKVTVVKEDCIFEMQVETPLACMQSKTINCRLNSKDSLYDLTPLMRNNSNYVVRDPDDHNITYYLNICRTIVDTKDLYCPIYSGACIKNLNEPNIMNKFKAIGRIQEKSAPVLENGNLVLSYKFGTYSAAEGDNYSTKIELVCNPKEEKPRLVSKISCNYKFIWKTPQACPKVNEIN